MLRKIINIDKNKCNGCGICVSACHEDAIEIINEKATLVSDEYCDGLGDCLPECPTGAITIIEREAKKYNEKLVEQKKSSFKNIKLPCGYPGTMAKTIKRKPLNIDDTKPQSALNSTSNNISQLKQWPIQIKLINSNSSYLQNADILIAGDCTAYAYNNIHKDFMKNRITLIGCPKLDDNNYYKEKFIEILNNNIIKSIKVLRMSVPCCSGIVNSIKEAMLESKTIVPYSEIIIDTDGTIISK